MFTAITCVERVGEMEKDMENLSVSLCRVSRVLKAFV